MEWGICHKGFNKGAIKECYQHGSRNEEENHSSKKSGSISHALANWFCCTGVVIYSAFLNYSIDTVRHSTFIIIAQCAHLNARTLDTLIHQEFAY